jgi:hypothetical protein
MGMKDASMIDIIKTTLNALTAMAINHCQSAWTTGEFEVPPVFGAGGGAQCK